LLCFVNCGIDTLVLEDFIIDRAAIPGSWPALFARLRPTRASAVGHAVYTLV
jgi:carbamoyltransferase